MPIDPELLAEARRRGIPTASRPPVDPELVAEAKRRGLTPAPATSSTGPSRIRQLLDATAEGAPTAGAMVGGAMGGAAGAAAGGVGAFPGAVAGAGIGGAGGKAYQRLYQYLQGMRDPANDSALGNASDMSKSGLAGMGAEVGTRALAAGAGAVAETAPAKYVGNALASGGARALKVLAAIPEKYGLAVLKKPSILNEAMLPSQRGAPYEAFEGYTGLKGLGKTIEESGRSTMPVGELDSLAVGTANKVRAGAPITTSSGMLDTLGAGEPVTAQNLYSASQAENHMMQAARNMEHGAARALESGILKRAGATIDAALESVYPEYQGLRQGNFESQAREAFSNVFPTNKNGTPNVLRPWAVAGEVLRNGVAHSPALPAVSPAAWGLGIRGVVAGTPLAKFLAKYGIQKKAQDVADELP